MAKTLDTRIRLRSDTYENWTSNNPVLLSGEVAVVDSRSVGDTSAPHNFSMKVGDGVTAFKDLPWVKASASDVADWAKAAAKPKYTATEVGIVELTAEEVQGLWDSVVVS